MDLLQRLITARKALGISQTTAGVALGLRASGFSQIERGESPLSVERFRKLCALYHVTQVEMLTGIQPNFDAEEVLRQLEETNTQMQAIRHIITGS